MQSHTSERVILSGRFRATKVAELAHVFYPLAMCLALLKSVDQDMQCSSESNEIEMEAA